MLILLLLFSCPVVSQLFETPWTAACLANLFLTISWSLPKFMSIALLMPSSHLILWCPLLLLPSVFPSIKDFSVSQLFASDDQNTGFSTSASVLPMSIQHWFPSRLTHFISLQSKGLLGVFSSTTVQRRQFFSAQLFLQSNFFYSPTLTSIPLGRL